MKLAPVAFAVAVALGVVRVRAAAPPPLVVHEWGTFTSLQDETGRAIGAINTDDEPVPGFVHRIGNLINASNELTGYYQGVPENHPSVTMRLETPVIYFHAPPGQPMRTVNVDVAFHGGWLTEFYPKAAFTAPGVIDLGISQANGGHWYKYGEITGNTVGTLNWPAVQIGAAGKGPDTDAKVWTAPRNVSAEAVNVGGEAEKFLFYRGVGNVDAPLRVERVGTGDQIQIDLKTGLKKDTAAALAHSPIWLVRVSPDGSVDWLRGYTPPQGRAARNVLGTMDASFYKTATHQVGLPTLHKDMANFLVKVGLFPDEAEAMLNTWEVSYFKSPGTRLFFMVPRQWTDAVVPLHISGNPPTVRVMVGRIEILTPRLEALVKQIETDPQPAPTTYPTTAPAPRPTTEPTIPRNFIGEAKANLDAGVPMTQFVDDFFTPDDKSYILLGRFRDALLIYEQAKHPNPRLASFMIRHGIEMHSLPLTGVSVDR